MASHEPLISSTVSAALTAALAGVEEGAVDAGLSAESARRFARQSLLGSALLMQDVAESPAALKDRVASPGGTTIAGLAVLEDQAARGTLLRAVESIVLGEGEGSVK